MEKTPQIVFERLTAMNVPTKRMYVKKFPGSVNRGDSVSSTLAYRHTVVESEAYIFGMLGDNFTGVWVKDNGKLRTREEERCEEAPDLWWQLPDIWPRKYYALATK
ncbi:hypothetical protein MMC26_004813 [Xylographa opegraphella]|nr:hypothetical protein [Xylographa opegraphella]